EAMMLDEAEADAFRTVVHAQFARDGVTPEFLAASVFLCEHVMLASLIRLQSWDGMNTPAVLRRYCDAMDAVIDLRERFDRRKDAPAATPPPAAIVTAPPPPQPPPDDGDAAGDAPLPRLGRRGQPLLIESLPPAARRRY